MNGSVRARLKETYDRARTAIDEGIRQAGWNAQGFLDTLEPLKIVGLKLPRGHAADVTVSPL